ncbi:hypothetical protein AB0J80_20165 [Actinoplanes sp. NPDC049548]|uniref:hypothetical protein n=1 Tax=Actinoplanes sp. NPDC049548 TaxID=3155152 RepID=UPI0034171CEC
MRSHPVRRRLAAMLAAACVVALAPVPASASVPAAPVRAAGNRKAYATMGTPAPRWNPCAPIGYRFNPARAPKGALADVKGAIRRISAATGLKFVYRGTTTAVPRAKKGYNPDYPANTQLVIAWVHPRKQSEWLPNNQYAGMGGPAWTTGYTATGKATGLIQWGGVVLNANLDLAGGFGTGPRYGLQGTRGQLLMHEIGHAIGLAHPDIQDQQQIMYGTMTRKKAVWGAGDLTGLRLVGASQGCIRREAVSAAVVSTRERVLP